MKHYKLSVGTLGLSLVVFAVGANAQAQERRSAKAPAKIMVDKSNPPQRAEISDTLRLSLAVQQVDPASDRSTPITETSEMFLIEDFPDRDNLPIVKVKIGGKDKLLLKAPKDRHNLRQGELILIDASQLVYVDTSTQVFTRHLSDILSRRWSGELCYNYGGEDIRFHPIRQVLGSNEVIGHVTADNLTAATSIVCKYKDGESYGNFGGTRSANAGLRYPASSGLGEILLPSRTPVAINSITMVKRGIVLEAPQVTIPEVQTRGVAGSGH